MRILIDENRFQIASYSDFGGKEIPDNIKVDCLAPSTCHKLKVDYQSFVGEEQWELDCTKDQLQRIDYEIASFEEYEAEISKQVAKAFNRGNSAQITTLQGLLVAEIAASEARIQAILDEVI